MPATQAATPRWAPHSYIRPPTGRRLRGTRPLSLRRRGCSVDLRRPCATRRLRPRLRPLSPPPSLRPPPAAAHLRPPSAARLARAAPQLRRRVGNRQQRAPDSGYLACGLPRRGPGAAPSRRCPATAPARFRPSRSRRFALASPASSLAQHLARAYSSLGRQLWSANVPCRPPHQQRMTHQASDYFSAHGQTSRSQFQPRFSKPNREALRRRSMMLPSDVRASANATSPHASPPLGPSIASTTSRKRRADNILRSDALHSATVSTDHRVVSVSSSSRSTRRWSSLAQTNATTNPALQCFGRHKRSRSAYAGMATWLAYPI
ncbi:uncharacterized protein [Miscanthus floridulus]|uniref:uncharacterized protein n=1 Tax=Miscanthus floridulus TaxID=154761 RepID=UPI003459B621